MSQKPKPSPLKLEEFHSNASLESESLLIHSNRHLRSKNIPNDVRYRSVQSRQTPLSVRSTHETKTPNSITISACTSRTGSPSKLSQSIDYSSLEKSFVLDCEKYSLSESLQYNPQTDPNLQQFFQSSHFQKKKNRDSSTKDQSRSGTNTPSSVPVYLANPQIILPPIKRITVRRLKMKKEENNQQIKEQGTENPDFQTISSEQKQQIQAEETLGISSEQKVKEKQKMLKEQENHKIQQKIKAMKFKLLPYLQTNITKQKDKSKSPKKQEDEGLNKEQFQKYLQKVLSKYSSPEKKSIEKKD